MIKEMHLICINHLRTILQSVGSIDFNLFPITKPQRRI